MTGKNQSVIILLSILILTTGCSLKSEQSSSDVSYEEFQDVYSELKEEFSPTGFMNISPPEKVILTTSFPEQKIDNKEVDALNNDLQYPLKYEIYYLSESSNLLVKVNFVYQPTNTSSSFLTINSINQLENPNILDQYSDLERPLIDEYVITQKGFLVLINFIDLSDATGDDYDQLYSEFIRKTTNFYGEFEDILLHISQ